MAPSQPSLPTQGNGVAFTLNNHLNQLQSQLAVPATAAAGDMAQYLQYHLQVSWLGSVLASHG